MLSFPQFTSPDDPYKDADSINELQNYHRVKLPEETEQVFTEEQNFDQPWIWLLLGVVTFGVFAGFMNAISLYKKKERRLSSTLLILS